VPYLFKVSDGEEWIRDEVNVLCPDHHDAIYRLEDRMITEAHPLGPVEE
jgi:hypothetical protein